MFVNRNRFWATEAEDIGGPRLDRRTFPVRFFGDSLNLAVMRKPRRHNLLEWVTDDRNNIAEETHCFRNSRRTFQRKSPEYISSGDCYSSKQLLPPLFTTIYQTVTKAKSFFTQSELYEPVAPQAAQLGIHFLKFLSQHKDVDAPSRETWLRTLHWWREAWKDRRRKKAQLPVGFKPMTSRIPGVCYNRGPH